MDIQLNLPRGERQQAFLDYLNAALRARLSSFTGSAGSNEEGLFESTVTGLFPVGQGTVELTWRITKDADGTLLHVTAEATEPHGSEDGWRIATHEFMTPVLATAFAETRATYFRRSFFCYVGPQLDGEYWLPGYRFAPAYPGDPDPHLLDAERVVSIDQNVTAIDDMHASAVADEAARRHAARLTLLLNTALHRPDTAQRWVMPVVDGTLAPESARYRLGFMHPSAMLTSMPTKGAQCPPGAYTGKLASRYRVAGKLLSLPPEARKILRGVDMAAPDVTEAFDCGARLYYVAAVCRHDFPSVALAYHVAAVEAVCQADRTCTSFHDFMRKHITSRRNLDVLLKYLYGSIRSAHFHGGAFPLGEFHRNTSLLPLWTPRLWSATHCIGRVIT